jgi:hypothetical protein
MIVIPALGCLTPRREGAKRLSEQESTERTERYHFAGNQGQTWSCIFLVLRLHSTFSVSSVSAPENIATTIFMSQGEAPS